MRSKEHSLTWFTRCNVESGASLSEKIITLSLDMRLIIHERAASKSLKSKALRVKKSPPPKTSRESTEPVKPSTRQPLKQVRLSFPLKKTSDVPNLPIFAQKPSYPWHMNSCWLDTSLEVLFNILGEPSALQDLGFLCSEIPETSGVLQLFKAMESQYNLQEDLPNSIISKELAQQRDILRAELTRRRALLTNVTFQTVMVSYIILLPRPIFTILY